MQLPPYVCNPLSPTARLKPSSATIDYMYAVTLCYDALSTTEVHRTDTKPVFENIEATKKANCDYAILDTASKMNTVNIAELTKMLSSDSIDLVVIDNASHADHANINNWFRQCILKQPEIRQFDKLMRDLSSEVSNLIHCWNTETHHTERKRMVREKNNDVWYQKFNKHNKN